MKFLLSTLAVFVFSFAVLADQISDSKALVYYSELIDPSKTIYSQAYWTKIAALKLEIARLEATSPLPQSFVESQADFYLQQLEEQ